MTESQQLTWALRRPMCASLISMATLFAVSPALAFDLISNAEYKAERAARGRISGLRDSLTPSTLPRIEIAAPDVSKKIKSPINLEVRFFTEAPAVVDPKTLRILYGALRLDITDRIRKAAKVTPTGIAAEGAKLPAGSHRLLIGIADSAGRYAEKEVKFESE